MRFDGVFFAVIISFLAAPLLAQAPAPLPPGASPLKTARDRVSYGIGRQIGADLKQNGTDLDVRLLVQGLTDALNGNPDLQTDEEFKLAVDALQKAMSERTITEG